MVAPPIGSSYSAGTTSVTVQWSSASGATAGYNVEVYTGSCGATSFNGGSTPANITSFQVSGLTNGRTYYWRVQSVGAGEIGRASCSEYGYSSVVPASPTVPTLVSPNSGSCYSAGTTSVTVQWSSASGATAGYLVEVYTGSCGATSFNGGSTPANITSFPVSGLTNGRTYYWRVQSVGAGGTTSAFSNCYSFSVSAPSPPAVPTLVSPNRGSRYSAGM